MYLRFDGSKSDDLIENDHLKIDRTIIDLLAITKCQSPREKIHYDILGRKIMTQIFLTCDKTSSKKIYLISKRQFEKYLSSRHSKLPHLYLGLKNVYLKTPSFLKLIN